MLLSIALIMLAGMGFSLLCRKIKLPGLFGMVIVGILLGPYVLNLIDPSVLAISAQLRKIALIIILARAGLTLNISDLKKMGRPAILMCFLPATLEMIGTVLLAPKLLSISTMEAALLGAVICAVSPAVIVPKMIRLIEEGYGTEKGIPQLILAGASADDVYEMGIDRYSEGNRISLCLLPAFCSRRCDFPANYLFFPDRSNVYWNCHAEKEWRRCQDPFRQI